MHHLYMFLMNTLTVPKIKDLVNKPTQQYQDLYHTMGGSAAPTPLTTTGGEGGLNLNTVGGQGAQPPLSDELSSFLSDLKKKNAVGPGSLGPNTVGPNTVGSHALGSTDKFPTTLGGEMGYSLY